VIRDCIDRLPAAVDAETRERAEAELLEHAEEYDATVLARIGRHLHTVLDPDGPEEVERAETNAVDFRELFLTPLDNGTVRLRGMLDAEGGAALQAALGPLAAPRPTTAEGTDRRTPATRRADALLELVAQAVAAGPPASSGAAAPTLTVTVSYEQLRDQLCGVLVDTETLVSPTTVRRLACDAGIVPAVLDAESQPLDIGRRSRTIPPAIRRAVELRDQHCVFPGCDRPPGFCQCHHIVHWADGGDTSVGNLALLCGHHHRLIHSRAGWTITATPGRSPTVHSPPWALAA
jgi:hypothetical protein